LFRVLHNCGAFTTCIAVSSRSSLARKPASSDPPSSGPDLHPAGNDRSDNAERPRTTHGVDSRETTVLRFDGDVSNARLDSEGLYFCGAKQELAPVSGQDTGARTSLLARRLFMFKTLYRCPRTIVRHENGPLHESRRRYLEHLAAQGAALHTIRAAAGVIYRATDCLNGRVQRTNNSKCANPRLSQPRGSPH